MVLINHQVYQENKELTCLGMHLLTQIPLWSFSSDPHQISAFCVETYMKFDLSGQIYQFLIKNWELNLFFFTGATTIIQPAMYELIPAEHHWTSFVVGNECAGATARSIVILVAYFVFNEHASG